MFKFNFSQVLDYPLDEEDSDSEGRERRDGIRIDQEEPQEPIRTDVCLDVTLEELLKTLSSAITYTPLIANNISILRRDLYDARFQIISEDTLIDGDGGSGGTDDNAMDIELETPTVKVLEPSMVPLPDDRPSGHDRPLVARLKDLEYIDAPSDVTPNVYEGGLKTWECSVDLVEFLSQAAAQGAPFRGRSILEVGCGTAIPSAFLLRSLLDEEPSATDNGTVLHLQDYNNSVLELVTVPNLLLAWYSSKASSHYRQSHSLPTPDPTAPAELSIDEQLLEAFTTSLNQHNIQLRFSAGPWSSFKPRHQSDAPFDLVITSETIYRSANVPALLSVLQSASARDQQQKAGLFASFSMFGKVPDAQSLILVAAKILYFGVGGSVDEFEGIARTFGASVTTVHETNVGVGRRIMKLRFP